MKSIQKLIYIPILIFLFTSCQTLDLETAPPNSVSVRQGSIQVQDQSTVIEYGILRVFKDAITKKFVLTNTKGQILRFSEITSDNKDFTVKVEQDTSILYPQQTLPFSVTFSPTLGGETVGNISFSTNDPAFPVFSFRVKGEGITPPEIIGNTTPQFEELNTVLMPDGGLNGTLFTIEINIEDTYDRIDPASLSVELQPIFSNGTRPNPVIKTPSEITLSEDKKRLSYSVAIRFDQSTFVDIETKLILGNGDISDAFKVRIAKPEAAN